MPRSRPRSLPALVILLALLAGSCSDDSSSARSLDLGAWLDRAEGEPGDPPMVGSGTGTEPTIVWDVSGRLHRGTLDVPLDHDDPEGETIELAVVRRPAADPSQRIGAILVNPGGPGASGIDLAPYFPFLFGEDLRERFDIVTWDPRGVGDSTNVRCGDGELMDRLAAIDPVPPTATALAEVEAVTKEFVAACEADSGDLLPHLHTPASALDMDQIRRALGDDQISYVGFSYGTLLGATYIELFPERVRAFVLDGAYSRSLSLTELGAGQAIGFEAALERFFESCLATGCRFGKGDLGAQFDGLMESIRSEPLATSDSDGRDLTVGLAWTGVIASLYTPELWSQLDRSLADARGGDGSGLLMLADFYLERSPGAEYSTQHYAFPAYNCMDSPPSTPAEEEEAAEEVLAVAPRVGPVFVSVPSPCEYWPVPPVGTNEPFSAPDAPPLLVIATTGDPATPYAWGVQLASELETARLLTVEGDGHTAYAGGNSCVDEMVEQYLITTDIPSGQLKC